MNKIQFKWFKYFLIFICLGYIGLDYRYFLNHNWGQGDLMTVLFVISLIISLSYNEFIEEANSFNQDRQKRLLFLLGFASLILVGLFVCVVIYVSKIL